jgi:hypothetical protein
MNGALRRSQPEYPQVIEKTAYDTISSSSDFSLFCFQNRIFFVFHKMLFVINSLIYLIMISIKIVLNSEQTL